MLLIAYDPWDYYKIRSVLDLLKKESYPYKVLTIGKIISIEDISSNNKDNVLLNVIDQLDTNKHFKDITSVLLCGDSVSMLGVAIAAFNRSIPVIHLGAGYRTYDPTFQDEIFRQMISRIASIHLCTTEHNAKNLTSEGIRLPKYIVGNPLLDTIEAPIYNNDTILLVDIDDTWNIEIKKLIPKWPKFKFEYTSDILPIDKIRKSKLIISHNTELQEITCYLHKPMIILGKKTDRPESLWLNVGRCMNPDYLATRFINLELHSYKDCPYGDGRAAEKILEILKKETKC